MTQAQEILLDLLTALRQFEAADEDDKAADAVAVEAAFKATKELAELGYRRGADGNYHKR